jgi:hypothetical protein
LRGGPRMTKKLIAGLAEVKVEVSAPAPVKKKR